MAPIPDPLETNFDGLSINDLIVTISNMADKAESHVALQDDAPEYVTRSAQLRQLSVSLGQARDSAAGHDRDRSKARDALVESAKMALTMNARHIALLSFYRKDPSILLNAGYELKQKSYARAKISLLDLVPDMVAKHGPVPGSVAIQITRAKKNGSTELQMTDQDPSVEEAWKSPGQGTYHKSRIELRDLEPAKILHFRARYHENGGIGRWCAPVRLIVL